MKFFTRELFQRLQTPESEAFDAAEREWVRAGEAYRVHLDSIRARLPAGMQAFAGTTLHDGEVESINRPSAAELVLQIDARRNPWGPVGVFRVRFTGVRDVEGVDGLVGSEWLYEEVHLHPAARFEYRVMFTDSDFRVVADEIEVTPLAPTK